MMLLLALALFVPCGGQSGNGGSIEGVVSDPTGAVVPEAAVTARNVETAASFHSVTDAHGTFHFLVVPVGKYEITAAHEGFLKVVTPDVDVTVGAKVTVTLTMLVGNRSESVTVRGDAVPIETTRSAFSTSVDSRSVASLPLNGRNFLNLMLLTPAIAPSANGGAFSGGFFSAGGQISMNSLLVDGADHNGFLSSPAGGPSGSNRYLFSQEAIQEFRVNTASYSAEFGRAGTAVVDVITKSGTNEYHGAAFWYYRDQALAAKSYMAQVKGEPKGESRSDQFGGALGGPIARDRLFFYASYDGQRRTEQHLVWMNLPSTFALSPKPEIAHYQQAALDYLEPRAHSYQGTFNQNVFLGKVDWHLSPSHSLSAQWNRHRLDAANMVIPGAQVSVEHNGTDGQVGDTLIATLTSTLSPAAVNVARGSYMAFHTPQTGNSFNPEALVSEGGLQVLQVGRLPKLADNGVRHAEFSDTLSLARGPHTIKAGGNMLWERARFFTTINFYGSYVFSSLESFGRSLEGTPAPQVNERFIQAFSGQGTPPVDVRPNSVQLAAFAEDTWHVRTDVTLDLGLRYDVQIMEQSSVANSSPSLVASGVDTSFIPTDHNNLAPRLGVAWTPRRSRRLVVRAGYGVFFPRLLAGTATRPFFYNGITAQTRTFTGALIPSYPDTKCGPPDSSPNCAAPLGGQDIIIAFAKGYTQPNVHQATVGFEYSVGKDLTVSATYLRVKSDHLTHLQDVNLPGPVTQTIGVAGTTTFLPYRYYPGARPMADFNRVFLLESNGDSSYHGLALQANKRWSHGFQFTASYTLAKVTDNNPTDAALNPGSGDSELLSDSLDPGLDRGPGDFSTRHRFVLGGIWELDYANHFAQPARAILSNWQLSAVVTASSGQPYSALLGGFDLNNDGNASTDRTPGVGRNTFVLPTAVSVDPRLMRYVPINQRVRLQISVDAFNVFNRVNVSGVTTTQFSVRSTAACPVAGKPCLVPQPAFGKPTGTNEMRTLQLSMRLVF